MSTATLGSLLPSGLVGLAILAVTFWLAHRFFGHFLRKPGERLSRRLARGAATGKPLKKRLVRNYRRAVRANFARHRLGFVNEETSLSTVDVMKIYVPLEYQAGGERRDVYEWLRRQLRVVILGPPGAGKSMLLKHSMLIWGSDNTSVSTRLPVLLDLHRCNGNDTPLTKLIQEELARNDVRMGPGLLDVTLREGKIALFFDGLDEVGRDDQDRVAGILKDFARAYPACQMLVTCRSAAYFGQLETELTQRIQVADFDDANIRRFMSNWPGMSAPDATRLFSDLQHNQNLMRLAASPLLLTMIAYLHTQVLSKSGRSLPGSRPAFYEMAIDHLLRRDHDLVRHRTISVYDWQDKLAILQRIALTLQDTPADRPDRRSIDRAQLLAITKGMLPDLNMGPEHAKPLIDEIDLRSQLLVRLDRRSSRYAFPHLTLQEYLAAVELTAQPEVLLLRYFADRSAWRETVKLWCGASSRDCTHVVRTIYATGYRDDRVLALECLAEAKRIDDQFARTVITNSLDAAEFQGWDERAVVAAFAAVAADGRPRGDFVFRLLADQAIRGRPSTTRWSMAALAGTRLPRAAAFLSSLAERGDQSARAALRSMGEQAIAALRSLALAGSLQALDDLAVVGTPAASEALTELLWDDDRRAARAAWHLASLIQNSDIEAGLRLGTINVRHESKRLDWVWAPFKHGNAGGLPTIVGRVAYLIDRGRASDIPPEVTRIDARLAIPLGVVCAVAELPARDTTPSEGLVEDFQSLGVSVRQFPNWMAGERALSSFNNATMPARVAGVCEKVLEVHAVDSYRRRIIRMLDDPTYIEAIVRVFCRFRPQASIAQWIALRDDPPESKVLKWSAVTFVALLIGTVLGIGGGRVVGTLTGSWAWGPTALSITLAALVGPVLLFAVFAVVNDIYDAFDFMDSVVDVIEEIFEQQVWILVLGTAVSVGGLTLLTASGLAAWTNWPIGIAILTALAALSGFLTSAYRKRQAAIDNPLRPIRDRAELNLSNRLSIIATSPLDR